ncbi:MAG: hypothetical protein M3541_17735 [Acidobacteriota bacterium]|nr:hypothetical protein [Acidobacteriota bacterium]MDQ3420584.1 hypothetical protein [Acidobacteriota bacterium]
MASLRSLAFLFVAAVLVAATLFTSRPSASTAETVHLASGSVISLRTPEFVQVGKRYAFTWAGGGPAQTYTVKSKREDGWIIVEVADENTNPAYFVPGDWPTRWLNIGTAISIQEMRQHQ